MSGAMIGRAHGERLAKIEADHVSQGREIARLHQGLVLNAEKADQIRTDLLTQMQTNHLELKSMMQAHQADTTKRMDKQDSVIDDLDRKQVAESNRRSGAVKALSVVASMVMAVTAWLTDFFGLAEKGS